MILLQTILLSFFITAFSLSDISQEGNSHSIALHRSFDKYGVTGTFVGFDLRKNRWVRHNTERSEKQFIPASTFKIFNTLVALETGVIANEHEIIPWDGVTRWMKDWNQDQSLTTAFRYSAVWFYQELARRIGESRMRQFIAREDYGNMDISGGIDRFWLDGALRVSANEQVAFLHRLMSGKTGFSPRSIRILKKIMVMEETEGYILRGKTGWATSPDDTSADIGWLVGWVERDTSMFFFAMNLETRRPDFPMVEARLTITRNILGTLGVLPLPECALTPPWTVKVFPDSGFEVLGEDGDISSMEAPTDQWMRGKDQEAELFVRSDGPSGSGRYWTIMVALGPRDGHVPTRGLEFKTTTIGYRTIREYPIRWLLDLDRDGSSEFILWDSFPLDEEDGTSFGLVAWVYRVNRSTGLAIDWDLSRLMAARVAAAYREALQDPDIVLASNRQRAAEVLEKFAFKQCQMEKEGNK